LIELIDKMANTNLCAHYLSFLVIRYLRFRTVETLLRHTKSLKISSLETMPLQLLVEEHGLDPLRAVAELDLEVVS
jgi:hypothetical protein